MDFDLRSLLLNIPGILFGFTIHEFAHAWTAWKLGDDTAERQGRLTLNPLAHLDPMGTLLILFAGFGWARPVPVNPARFQHPRRDDVLVTLAGPASNLVTAGLMAVAYRLIPAGGAESLSGAFSELLYRGIYFNLLLCFFNLIPIFPLDGARILRGLLPLNQAYAFSKLESVGPLILLAIIALGSYARIDILGRIIGPPIKLFMGVFTT
ncbi:MAG TPA: site-2 protease family protein [Candidatus Eisenbacteria bacterium]